jgi:hypothetical protein
VERRRFSSSHSCRARHASASIAVRLWLPAFQHDTTRRQATTNSACGSSKQDAPATTSSAARGAKQLVVVRMQAMASAPRRATCCCSACRKPVRQLTEGVRHPGRCRC